MQQMKLSEIVWDPKVYPRGKWSTATIERYVDALEAGEEFPPVVIEEGTNRLLDGKHRVEMWKRAGVADVPVEVVRVPDGMSAKYFAASMSVRHGDRLSNADIKALAEEEFEANPKLNAIEWGKALGVSKSTVYRWVSHIIERETASRASQAWHLAQLGWTQKEIGERLEITQGAVSQDIKNSHLGNINNSVGEHWNEKGIAELANRLNLPLPDCYAAAMLGMDDAERLKTLNIKVQPYDVWHFSGCHDLMGDKHPGRIPGELVCHVLYFLTQPGDLVVDPMAGSGTTLDACLLMGRKCRGYDIDGRHERIDIEEHDLSNGWPDAVKKASLVFWDPPYFDKMDHGNIGEEGYVEGSISGLSPDEYLAWFGDRFTGLSDCAKPGTKLAFLMSDWDSENAKKHKDHPGLFLWDYARMLSLSGWRVVRQVQCPLSTQQIHPDIVNKFRGARRMARLGRSLMVAENE